MKRPWFRLPMVGFDFEATLRDPREARPVSAAVTVVDASPDVVDHRWGDTDWLINPRVEIPEESVQVHGITTERAREEGTDAAASIDSIIERLIDAIFATERYEERERGVSRPIVGMNLAYDLTLLHYDALRHGVRPFRDRVESMGLTVPVIDIYVLDKRLDRYRKGGRRLADLCQTYRVRHDGAHDAMEDVLAACRVAVRIGQGSYVGELPTTRLHQEQIEWRREQCVNLQTFFRGQGKSDCVIDPCWPACYPETHQEPAPEAAEAMF